MRRAVRVLVLAATGAGAAGASPAYAQPSLWTGAWTLDAARSSPGAADMAAPGYEFRVAPDGGIVWKIPAIGEIASGRMDGTPMVVTRRTPRPGMMLSVTAEGPYLLRYRVLRDGRTEGAGLMRLIEGGKAWVDISWNADRPSDAGELVYRRN